LSISQPPVKLPPGVGGLPSALLLLLLLFLLLLLLLLLLSVDSVSFA